VFLLNLIKNKSYIEFSFFSSCYSLDPSLAILYPWIGSKVRSLFIDKLIESFVKLKVEEIKCTDERRFKCWFINVEDDWIVANINMGNVLLLVEFIVLINDKHPVNNKTRLIFIFFVTYTHFD
jgi:hypothetical protein